MNFLLFRFITRAYHEFIGASFGYGGERLQLGFDRSFYGKDV
jgi:hypothetical protein